MATVDLVVTSRDGFFFKDGRGWHTSASGRAHGLDWPFPMTIRGALRTAWGRYTESILGQSPLNAESWQRRTTSVRLDGMVALRAPLGIPWAIEHRMWPVPADALYVQQPLVERLNPQPSRIATLGIDEDPAREKLWRPVLDQRAKPQSPPHWWPDADFVAWLCGARVTCHTEEEKRMLSLSRRPAVHVGIDPERLAGREGILYSVDVLETLAAVTRASGTGGDYHEWAIGIRAELPEVSPRLTEQPFTVGGQRKVGRIAPLDASLFVPPASLTQAFRDAQPGEPRGLRLVVVTPARFERGWLLDGFSSTGAEYRGRLPGLNEDLVLRAALMSRPLHFTGWDMATGAPKETLRLVPPGAVYFFQKLSGDGFTADECRAMWFRAIGAGSDDGLGRVVPGLWTPHLGDRSKEES